MTRRYDDWRARGERKLADLRGRLPTVDLVVRRAIDPSTIDRCFVLAAQILTTAIPMLVAVTAFAPQFVRERIVQTVTQVFGLESGNQTEVTRLVSGTSLSRQSVGLAGLIFALVSMTSLAARHDEAAAEAGAGAGADPAADSDQDRLSGGA